MRRREDPSFSSFLLSSLALSATQVYEPYIRARHESTGEEGGQVGPQGCDQRACESLTMNGAFLQRVMYLILLQMSFLLEGVPHSQK